MSDHWTKVPNTYWEVQDDLKPAEAKLLLWVIRLTNGFQRDAVQIGGTQLEERTKISRAHLHKAKRALEDKGLLLVDRDGPACVYRLGAALTGQAAAVESEPPPPPKGVSPARPRLTKETPSHPRDPQGSHERDGSGLTGETQTRLTGETGCTLKESIKENSKETSSPRAFEPDRNDDVFSKDLISEDDQAESVRLLRSLRVDKPMALKLAASRPLERVKRTVERARRDNVRDKAAYVVSALLPDEEWSSVPAAELVRQNVQEISEMRARKRQAEECRRDEEQLRARMELDHLVGQADQVELAAAEAYARSHFRGAMASAAPDAPHIRALMLDFFRARASPRERVS